MTETIDPDELLRRGISDTIANHADLVAAVTLYATNLPDAPAAQVLSVKQYDALCRLIPCQPVTPLRIAARRLRELTEVSGGN